MNDDDIIAAPCDNGAEAAIMDLVRECGAGKSIGPTDAARRLAERSDQASTIDTWRRHLPDIRRAALRLAQSGAIDILRKGTVVAPEAVRGVIRLRLKKNTEER